MAPYRHVALVGVGLLGGSIGLALREKGFAERVVGFGRNVESLQAACRIGRIDAFSDDLATAVQGADVAIVCTPVASVAGLALAIEPLLSAGGFVTDVGSVKGTIVREVESALPNARFVGSHPMAGGEKNGHEHARADLFQDALTILTPTPATDRRTLDAVRQFWTRLGSRIAEVSPEEHDRAVASASHVPHLVASALSAATPNTALTYAAGGWKDATRIASGDVEMWRQIFAANRIETLAGLDGFLGIAERMRTALADGDDAELVRILEEGKRRRDAVGS